MKKTLSLLSLLLVLTSFTYDDEVKNYYGIPETIAFDNIPYKLTASYHPNDIYYKQEYIPAGESADHFNKMVMVDFVITDAPAKTLIGMKIKELNDREKDDPVVNYDMMENAGKGEYILDFVLSEQNGGKVSTVERNVYRYKGYTDSLGHKGILLFAISQRGYGDDIVTFFGNLKKTRIDYINKVARYDLPKIEIK